MKDALDIISAQVRQLEKTILEMYKPKQELKEIAGKLLFQVEKLQSDEMRQWIEGKTNDTSDQENSTLKNEIQDLRKQLVQRKLEDPTYNQVQCDKCKEESRKRARREILTKNDNYDTFKQATDEDWRDEIFPSLRIQRGDIWEASRDHALVLPCNKDFTTTDRAVARLIERLGGKEDLERQGKEKGEMAIMLHSLGFPDDEGNFTNKSRVIYYPITSEGNGTVTSGDEWVLQSLKAVKNHAIQHNTNKLAIPEMEGVNGIIICRMLEFLFVNTNIEIIMYKNNEKVGVQNSKRRLKSTQAGGGTNNQRRPRQEALLVKMNNTAYDDLLKTVKQTINPTDIGVEVKNLKR